MQRLHDSLIRIVKGPTGGFLASLGIAAVLGGVALASPAPPIADVTGHPAEVVAADPLGSYPASSAVVASGVPTVTGGVQTDADPTGRGPALDPTQYGPAASGSNTAHGSGSAGGVRSAGLTPAHQDARDDPAGGSAHHQGSGRPHGSGPGIGQPGQGDQGSGGQQGDGGTGSGSGNSGSGGAGSGGSGTGRTGSGDRGDGGGSGSGRRGAGGSGSGGGDNTPDAHSSR